MKETDFPILKQKINGKRLVYLDNSATTQKPASVIDAIKEYYETINSNTHRGTHTLATKATEAFEKTRELVAKFINSETEEVIFTKGTTESLNIVAHGLSNEIKAGDVILLSEMEHHSNITPWQIIAKERKAKILYVAIDKNGELTSKVKDSKGKVVYDDPDQIPNLKVVSLTHMSNVLGRINNIEFIGKKIRKMSSKIFFVVDAAQSAPHMKIDVKKLDCDFLAFSAHKMMGPTGVGVLYGKKELLEKLEPFNYGGHMIKEVALEKSTWNDVPYKFEGGTQNISGVIAFGKAIEYINKIGVDKIKRYCDEITQYALKRLKEIKQIKVLGPQERGPVISFHIEGMHSHDVSELLDREGVAIRGGHHCAMPLMKVLNIPGCSRASFYFYNTKEDVDTFIEALKKAIQVFKL